MNFGFLDPGQVELAIRQESDISTASKGVAYFPNRQEEPEMKEPEEQLHLKLRRLCDEHAAAVQALVGEHARTVDEALTDCLATMAKIENDADAELAAAWEEYRSAGSDSEQAGGSPAHWECQKRINQAVTKARDAAQAERNAYMEKCKAAQARLDDLNNKARIDLLKGTQKVFQGLDIGALDSATVAQTAQAIWSGCSSSRVS
jgi:hypothetical protein